MINYISKLFHKNKPGQKRYMNLQARFLISFFIIILIPFVAFALLISYKSEEVIKKHITSQATESLSQFSFLLDAQLYEMESVMNEITSNRYIYDTFIELYTQNTDEELIPKQMKMYLKFQLFYPDAKKLAKIDGIYYFNRNDCFNLFSRDINHILGSKAMSEDWYRNALSKAGTTYFPGANIRHFRNGEETLVMSGTKLLKEVGAFSDRGVLLVDFNYNDLFKSVLEKVGNSEYLGKNFYVCDKNNLIMYNKNPNLLLNNLDYSFINDVKSINSGSSTVNINNTKFYYTYYTSQLTGWKFIILIPIDELNRDFLSNKAYILILTLFITFVVLVFSFIASSKILKPINNLIKSMLELRSGNLSIRLANDRNDETKILSDSFNEMAADLERMINTVYKCEIKQKEAEILSLQSQINPHFLYNTLDSIRGTAIASGADDIAHMSKCLASMMRYSINKNMIVSIQDEIYHLENYIAIQRFRFDDRFEFKFDIPKELTQCRLLRLTLQPLVENSIKHGLEKIPGKGVVGISLSKLENVVKIKIEDSGPGMSIEKTRELNERLKALPETSDISGSNDDIITGIGVINVNLRIKLFFGTEFGIKYLETTTGTTLEILLPYTNKED